MSPLREGFWKPDLYLGWEGGTTLSSHHSSVPSLPPSIGDFQRAQDMPFSLQPLRKGLIRVPGPWLIL